MRPHGIHRCECAIWLACLLGFGFPVRGLAEEESGWEDPEKVQYYWKRRLPAGDYARAIQATGQSVRSGPRGALGPWTAIGPTGDFTEAWYNGRISGIHIRSWGSSYRVYVGACSGGLWRANADDGVGVWTSIGDALPNPSVRALAVQPDNASIILVGTGDWNRYGGSGLYRSTDGGTSWTQITLPVEPDVFFTIVHNPLNPSIVLAASEKGILRSTDGGLTWEVRHTGTATDLVLDPSNANVQYACVFYPGQTTGRGVYRSTDGGVSWSMLSSPALPSGTSFDRASIAICRDAPSHLAVVVENDNLLEGIYGSADSGATWAEISTADCDGMGGGQIAHAQAITFRPDDPNEIFAGSGGLVHTTDGGAHWTQTWDEDDTGHADITQLYFSAATGDDVLWICNDGGVYRRTLGSSLESWNGDSAHGLRCSQIDYMDAQQSLATMGLQDNGIVFRTSPTTPWTLQSGGDGFGVGITDVLNNVYWYCDGVYSSEPTHRIFRVVAGGTGESTGNLDGHYNMFFDDRSDQMFAVGNTRLTSSPVFGSLPGWGVETALPALDDHEVFGSRLRAETLYVTYWSDPYLTVCRNSGGAWQIESYTTPNTVDTVFASTERPGEAWAGLTGDAGTPKLLHTTDHWATWEDLTGSLSVVGMVESIVVTPFNAKQIFVGTDIGMFWSEDGGTTWEAFQDGMPVECVTNLRYIARTQTTGSDRLVAATYGRGMYERLLEGPPIVYVDPGHTGSELGLFEYPYNTFAEGLNAAPDGAVLGLRAGTYVAAPPTIDWPLTIGAYDGTVVLGN